MCSIFTQPMVLCVITMYVFRDVIFGCIDVHHSLSMHVCNWCAGLSHCGWLYLWLVVHICISLHFVFVTGCNSCCGLVCPK